MLDQGTQGGSTVFAVGSSGSVISPQDSRNLYIYGDSVWVTDSQLIKALEIGRLGLIYNEDFGNTFSENAAINLYGSVEQNIVIQTVENLSRFFLLETDFVVAENTTLLVDAGVRIASRNDQNGQPQEINAQFDGAVYSRGADWSEHIGIDVSNGGLFNAVDSFVGGAVKYRAASEGKMQGSHFDGNIEIRNAFMLIRDNVFAGEISVAGHPANDVDMRFNNWLTDEVDEIEDRIFHQIDDPSLPLVLFEPFIT